jgi:hypothetical protein
MTPRVHRQNAMPSAGASARRIKIATAPTARTPTNMAGNAIRSRVPTAALDPLVIARNVVTPAI